MLTDNEMNRAREFAADWHNGQGSALYAFASTGRVIDREQAHREIRACQTNSATQRLRLAILRTAIDQQADAQQRQVLADILNTPRPELWSLDHTQPGALDADKAYVTAVLEHAARDLEWPLYARFLAHLGKLLDRLAAAYHCPLPVNNALQAHADQELERIHAQD